MTGRIIPSSAAFFRIVLRLPRLLTLRGDGSILGLQLIRRGRGTAGDKMEGIHRHLTRKR